MEIEKELGKAKVISPKNVSETSECHSDRKQIFEKKFTKDPSTWIEAECIEFYHALKNKLDPAFDIAWKRVYQIMLKLIRQKAFKKSEDQSWAEDIVGDAFANAFNWLQNGEITEPGKIVSFVRRCAFHKYVDYLRHKKGIIFLPAEAPIGAEEGEAQIMLENERELSPEDYAIFFEMTGLFRKILEWMNQQKDYCKESIRLFLLVRQENRFKNLTALCNHLNLNYDTLNSHIHRCIDKLRSHHLYPAVATLADRLFGSINKKRKQSDGSSATDISEGIKS
jgi:DNA-directed RNA polymerase specialized sigma24 family protein